MAEKVFNENPPVYVEKHPTPRERLSAVLGTLKDTNTKVDLAFSLVFGALGTVGGPLLSAMLGGIAPVIPEAIRQKMAEGDRSNAMAEAADYKSPDTILVWEKLLDAFLSGIPHEPPSSGKLDGRDQLQARKK